MEPVWDFEFFISVCCYDGYTIMPFYGPQVETLADVCSKRKLYLYIHHVHMQGYAQPLHLHTHSLSLSTTHSTPPGWKEGTDVCMSHLSPIMSPLSVSPYGLVSPIKAPLSLLFPSLSLSLSVCLSCASMAL